MKGEPVTSVFERACALAARGDFAQANALTAGDADPNHAALRAMWAMQSGALSTALSESERAIRHQLLLPGITLEAWLDASLRGASGEGLLRYSVQRIARDSALCEPLAIRWRCLQRLGRGREAREMRALCLVLFRERASVWAEAGNQALDDGDDELAARYFAECLTRMPDQVTALVGLAIVHERRKAFDQALILRKRVVEVTSALTEPGPANVQRTVRLGAALLRVDRVRQAEAMFRHALLRGAYALLPAERPVLRKVASDHFPDLAPLLTDPLS